jgi:release factor glutamine methyltransferase
MFDMGVSYRLKEEAHMSAEGTVGAALARATQRLLASGASGRAPALDAELLLAYVLGVSRAHLSAHPERPLEPDGAAHFMRLLRRRAGGEPVAYLTGKREFWSLELTVTDAVLIPRPESELLVERALALLSTGAASLADLGTGSGALALALARERPEWQLVATDVSAAALELARGNAGTLGLRNVEFRLGDWFQALPASQRFDLLLSNPPYVAADDPALEALRHEPRVALTPGGDGFAALRHLAGGAAAHLRSGGWLLLEHGATQGAQVRAELVLNGFRHVRSHPDLAGHERVTEGQQ